jgi:hypothetical protein
LNLPENIKEFFRKYYLRSALKRTSRRKKLVNLAKASSVGIVFEVNDEKEYQAVHDYILKLQDMKIKAKAMGYVREKHLSHHFMQILSFDFIYEKDLNWFGKPKTKKPQEFWSSDFDVCINIASPNCFPLKYIICKSVSSLKVGPFTEKDKEYYDILVRPGDEHDQINFLQQIHDYLIILNPK